MEEFLVAHLRFEMCPHVKRDTTMRTENIEILSKPLIPGDAQGNLGR